MAPVPSAEARNAYSYSADGEKLRVVKKYNSNFNTSPIIGSAVNVSSMDVTKTTDYVDGKLFENNVLDRIFVDGGYIKGGVYYFYETDHLGSNRTTISEEGDLSDYYPYGMQMGHNDPDKGNALVQIDGYAKTSFKFSGKELDVMHGLNLYDSQARWYDPCIPILPTVDPLCEKKPWISPYVYCADNPLKYVDPDGKDYVLTINQETNTVTIQATYYASSQDLKSAQQAAEYWNNQSGNYTYQTEEGNYSVQFSLTAVEVKTDASMSANQVRGELNSALSNDKSGGGNVYSVVPGFKDANTNGTTSNGNFVQVKDSRKDTDTGAHEIGHTLGLTHSTSGIMTPSSTDGNRNNSINTERMQEMFSYPLQGKTNSEAGNNAGKGTVQYFIFLRDYDPQYPLLSPKGKVKKHQ